MTEIICVYQTYIYPEGMKRRTLLASMVDNEVNKKLIDYYVKFLMIKGFAGLKVEHEETYNLEGIVPYELCEDLGTTFITKLEKDIIERDWKSDMIRYLEMHDLYTEIIEIMSTTNIETDLKLHLDARNDLSHLLDNKRNRLEFFIAYANRHPIFNPKERESIIDGYWKELEMKKAWKLRLELEE